MIRLILKQHRFGILGFGLILAAMVGALAWLASYFGGLDIAGCRGLTTPDCMAVSAAVNAAALPTVMLRSAATPVAIFAGVFPGTPIIAAEVERSTAVIPWTIGRSRIRWLVPRLLLIGLLLGVLTAAIGIALDAITQAIYAWIPVSANLRDYETRGWFIPARALVGFAAGVLAGAVLGRALPGLLAGMVVAAVIAGAFAGLGTVWNNGASAVVDQADEGAIVTRLVLLDRSTGAYVDYAEAEATVSPDDPAFAQRYTEVSLGVPGVDARLLVARECAVLLGATLLLGAASLLVIQRRRPY